MSSIPRRLLSRVSNITATALGPCGPATVVTFQFPTALASKKVLLYALRMIHVSGAAADTTLTLWEESTASVLESKVAAFSAVLVADLITLDDLVSGGNGARPLVAKLDANARFYAVPAPDAGADNTYVYVIDYEETSTQAPADTVN